MTISPEELALKLKYIVDINHIGLYAKIHDRLYSENVEILRTALQAERADGILEGLMMVATAAQASASASPPPEPPSPPCPAGEGAGPPASREE